MARKRTVTLLAGALVFAIIVAILNPTFYLSVSERGQDRKERFPGDQGLNLIQSSRCSFPECLKSDSLNRFGVGISSALT
eukprot:6838163-Pyramimonas_sp.AAC.1